VGKPGEPPKWIKPKFTRIADEAPAGNDWLHEIKYDSYRMHARLDRGKIQLLARTGLDWSRRYPRTIESLRALPVKAAHLDGELCCAAVLCKKPPTPDLRRVCLLRRTGARCDRCRRRIV